MEPRVFNFSAGPAVLPLPVLQQAQEELLSLPGVGISVLEMSHRSKPFVAILERAEADLRRLLDLPQSYHLLFLQGGSRLQFSMVPMNLLRGSGKTAEYLVTGSWGESALKEAQREGPTRITWSGKPTGYDRLPAADALGIAPDAAYLHLTSNETIQGVQFSRSADEQPGLGPAGSEGDRPPGMRELAELAGAVPLVCDASSDFLSRPIDVAHYGLIYACAQKNAGPAGVTMVIIRDDLLKRAADGLPSMLDYRPHADEHSLYNTPPTFAIYLVGLVARWLLEEIGGLDRMHQRNQAKAARLYDVVDRSEGFYRGHAQPNCRSLMNVTFRLASEDLEQQFLAEAAKNDLYELKGHRSVGGIRASIYNAMPPEGVEKLAQFMTDFARRRG